jgi:sec-independent protein translocase protein TatB
MFDLGWGELLVVGVVALVVLGPKELPNALRTVSNLTKTARKLAGEFQSGINEIVREAELEDARKAAQSITKGSISQAIEKVVDPTGEMKSAVKSVEQDVKDVKTTAQISPVGPIPPAPSIAPPPAASPVAPDPAIAAPEPAKDAEAADNAAPKAEAKV